MKTAYERRIVMSPQAAFLLQTQVVPRLRSAIPNVVAFIGSENAEELVQDGAAIAARIMHNAERAGKKVVRSARGGRGREITAGNVAYYTIEKLRSGRRSAGSTVADVHGAGTQIKGNARLTSLDEVAAVDEESGGEIFEFHDVLAADQEDPAIRAARKLDWQAFWAGLPERERVVIGFMIEGRTLRAAAESLKCSDSIVHLSRRNLAEKILDFMGADILVEVRRQPRWKDGLTATRERLACREERRQT